MPPKNRPRTNDLYRSRWSKDGEVAFKPTLAKTDWVKLDSPLWLQYHDLFTVSWYRYVFAALVTATAIFMFLYEFVDNVVGSYWYHDAGLIAISAAYLLTTVSTLMKYPGWYQLKIEIFMIAYLAAFGAWFATEYHKADMENRRTERWVSALMFGIPAGLYLLFVWGSRLSAIATYTVESTGESQGLLGAVVRAVGVEASASVRTPTPSDGRRQ
jgi:hypothetical protein